MHILVGTLYTIENEFDECCASIKAQTYQDFEHIVFKGLPNKEAHDTLHRTFEQRLNEFDLMIKIDADMVIEDRHLFEKIVKKFREDAKLNWICIKVHDFYCNRLIWGVDVYRNNIRWRYQEENLFTDRIMDPDSIRKKEIDVRELAPAAIHCKNPSPFQAFHFGVHRGLKCVQPGRFKASKEVLHWNVFKDVLKHYEETKDKRLAYALAGFELALTSFYDDTIVSNENAFLFNLFNEKFEPKADEDLWKYIRRKRLYRMAMLPYPLDYGVVYGMQRLRALLFRN